MHWTVLENAVEIDYENNEETGKGGHCFGMMGEGTLCHGWRNIKVGGEWARGYKASCHQKNLVQTRQGITEIIQIQ